MGKRGPPPEPTPLRILRGNPGKRPINRQEPQPSRQRPTCPRWLDREAKREWRRIVPELDGLGLLTLVDRAALAAYCQSWGEWRWATEMMEVQGRIYHTDSGQIKARPEVAIAHKALDKMKSFLTEFGLTPASRTRLKAPEQPEASIRDLLG